MRVEGCDRSVALRNGCISDCLAEKASSGGTDVLQAGFD